MTEAQFICVATHFAYTVVCAIFGHLMFKSRNWVDCLCPVIVLVLGFTMTATAQLQHLH